MRRYLALGTVLAAGFLVYRWTREPTTELVDAAGSELTVGPARARSDALWSDPVFAPAQQKLEDGDAQGAKELLIALLEQSERDGETCILLSRATRELGQVDEAVDYGLKAVALLPEEPRAHLAHSKALGLQLLGGGILSAAKGLPAWKKSVARVLELDPDNVEARTDQIYSYIMAPGLLGGDVEHAIELSKELMELDPARGRLTWAMAHIRREEPERAIAVCEAGVSEDPDAFELQAMLGALYAKEGRREEADRAYLAALRGPRDETYFRALHGRARMRLEGDYELDVALALLERFLRERPERGWLTPRHQILVEQGRVLVALGRPEEAREALEAALALKPGYDPALEAIQALE